MNNSSTSLLNAWPSLTKNGDEDDEQNSGSPLQPNQNFANLSSCQKSQQSTIVKESDGMGKMNKNLPVFVDDGRAVNNGGEEEENRDPEESKAKKMKMYEKISDVRGKKANLAGVFYNQRTAKVLDQDRVKAHFGETSESHLNGGSALFQEVSVVHKENPIQTLQSQEQVDRENQSPTLEMSSTTSLVLDDPHNSSTIKYMKPTDVRKKKNCQSQSCSVVSYNAVGGAANALRSVENLDQHSSGEQFNFYKWLSNDEIQNSNCLSQQRLTSSEKDINLQSQEGGKIDDATPCQMMQTTENKSKYDPCIFQLNETSLRLRQNMLEQVVASQQKLVQSPQQRSEQPKRCQNSTPMHALQHLSDETVEVMAFRRDENSSSQSCKQKRKGSEIKKQKNRPSTAQECNYVPTSILDQTTTSLLDQDYNCEDQKQPSMQCSPVLNNDHDIDENHPFTSNQSMSRNKKNQLSIKHHQLQGQQKQQGPTPTLVQAQQLALLHDNSLNVPFEQASARKEVISALSDNVPQEPILQTAIPFTGLNATRGNQFQQHAQMRGGFQIADLEVPEYTRSTKQVQGPFFGSIEPLSSNESYQQQCLTTQQEQQVSVLTDLQPMTDQFEIGDSLKPNQLNSRPSAQQISNAVALLQKQQQSSRATTTAYAVMESESDQTMDVAEEMIMCIDQSVTSPELQSPMQDDVVMNGNQQIYPRPVAQMSVKEIRGTVQNINRKVQQLQLDTLPSCSSHEGECDVEDDHEAYSKELGNESVVANDQNNEDDHDDRQLIRQPKGNLRFNTTNNLSGTHSSHNQNSLNNDSSMPLEERLSFSIFDSESNQSASASAYLLSREEKMVQLWQKFGSTDAISEEEEHPTFSSKTSPCHSINHSPSIQPKQQPIVSHSTDTQWKASGQSVQFTCSNETPLGPHESHQDNNHHMFDHQAQNPMAETGPKIAIGSAYNDVFEDIEMITPQQQCNSNLRIVANEERSGSAFSNAAAVEQTVTGQNNLEKPQNQSMEQTSSALSMRESAKKVTSDKVVSAQALRVRNNHQKSSMQGSNVNKEHGRFSPNIKKHKSSLNTARCVLPSTAQTPKIQQSKHQLKQLLPKKVQSASSEGLLLNEAPNQMMFQTQRLPSGTQLNTKQVKSDFESVALLYSTTSSQYCSSAGGLSPVTGPSKHYKTSTTSLTPTVQKSPYENGTSSKLIQLVSCYNTNQNTMKSPLSPPTKVPSMQPPFKSRSSLIGVKSQNQDSAAKAQQQMMMAKFYPLSSTKTNNHLKQSAQQKTSASSQKTMSQKSQAHLLKSHRKQQQQATKSSSVLSPKSTKSAKSGKSVKSGSSNHYQQRHKTRQGEGGVRVIEVLDSYRDVKVVEQMQKSYEIVNKNGGQRATRNHPNYSSVVLESNRLPVKNSSASSSALSSRSSSSLTKKQKTTKDSQVRIDLKLALQIAQNFKVKKQSSFSPAGRKRSTATLNNLICSPKLSAQKQYNTSKGNATSSCKKQPTSQQASTIKNTKKALVMSSQRVVNGCEMATPPFKDLMSTTNMTQRLKNPTSSKKSSQQYNPSSLSISQQNQSQKTTVNLKSILDKSSFNQSATTTLSPPPQVMKSSATPKLTKARQLPAGMKENKYGGGVGGHQYLTPVLGKYSQGYKDHHMMSQSQYLTGLSQKKLIF